MTSTVVVSYSMTNFNDSMRESHMTETSDSVTEIPDSVTEIPDNEERNKIKLAAGPALNLNSHDRFSTDYRTKDQVLIH